MKRTIIVREMAWMMNGRDGNPARPKKRSHAEQGDASEHAEQ